MDFQLKLAQLIEKGLEFDQSETASPLLLALVGKCGPDKALIFLGMTPVMRKPFEWSVAEELGVPVLLVMDVNDQDKKGTPSVQIIEILKNGQLGRWRDAYPIPSSCKADTDLSFNDL